MVTQKPSKPLPDVQPTQADVHDQVYVNPRIKRLHPEDEAVHAAPHADDSALGPALVLRQLRERPPSYTMEDALDLNNIFWDHYCRPLVAANLNRLRNDWQLDAVGALYVSKRPNGHYAGLEGRHRYTVALEKGITQLPARVYNDLTYEQEAVLYNLFNRYSAHSAINRLQARVEAKVPMALSMQSMLKELGLVWDFDGTGKTNAIKPAATVERALTTWGAQVVRDALKLLYDAWGAKNTAFHDDTVGGAVQFLARYGGYSFSIAKYDRTRMLEMMRSRGLRQFRSEAVQISLAEHLRRSHSFGRAMRSIYNLNLPEETATRHSRRLPPWPERFYSDAGLASRNESLRTAIAKLTPEEKTRRVQKGWQTRHG